MIIGVDASNLLDGGGVTHLREILRAAAPTKHGVRRVIVWGARQTLDSLDARPWLELRAPEVLGGGLLERAGWQTFRLGLEAKAAGCNVLFSPGGLNLSSFHPFVTMSRNMLPFDQRELRTYGSSAKRARLELLRRLQLSSMRRADGVIFLTEYARRVVASWLPKLAAKSATIPHGVGEQFRRDSGASVRAAESPNGARPVRLVYVSPFEPYKHHSEVVAAAGLVRAAGFDLELTLIGAGTDEVRVLPRCEGLAWVKRLGKVPHEQLPALLHSSDVGVFASSCENLPNVLLEYMAAGMPIVCSRLGPMPEVLGDAGVYADPEDPASLANAILEIISSERSRSTYAAKAFERGLEFRWTKCAEATFAFLAEVATRHPDALAR